MGELVDVVDMKLKRRGQADSRQARHHRPPAGTPLALCRTEDHQHYPGGNPVEGQRGPGRGVQRRPQGGRPAVQGRGDRFAQLLHGHGGRVQRRGRLSRAPPATSNASSTISRSRAWTPSRWTCVSTAAGRSPRRSASPDCSSTTDRWSRSRTPTAASAPSNDPDPDDRLGWAAGRAHQQVQRQRQRDLRRRHPGLPPRPDRRRSLHPRQGDGAKPVATWASRLFRFPTRRRWAPEDHHAAVLSPQRRQHAETRRAGRRRAALAHHPPRRGRGRPGLSRRFRPRRAA